VRRAVRSRLPKLLRKAMADYAAFAALPVPDDAKGFAGHQAACKAALAHLDAGAKLLAWAEGPGPSAGDTDDLARLIQAAEDAVAIADPDSI
jgi:hypothetical protein